jgi:hypothetical protein
MWVRRAAWHDGGVAEWMEFRRSDAAAVIDLVRAVAEATDPGEHGDGVEVVIEAPRKGWFGRLADDGLPEQARIGVTKFGGAVRYPFHVHLVTDRGGAAARRLPRQRGWAVSNSNGLAFLIQKGGSGDRPDWAALVSGAVAALSALRPDADDEGWRAGIDRAVRRT